MNDLREINYRNLKALFDLSDARKAARRIDSATTVKKARDLGFLLRHHDEQGITDRETWQRDQFDELIHYYSIMEIAALIDLIPNPLPEDLQQSAMRHLREPSVNQYFVSNYPLVLPQLFELRVCGFSQLKASSAVSLVPLFLQLLQLDSMIHGGDEDVDTLLWFLDGGSIDGYDIDDTLDALKDAGKFFKRLRVEPDKMTMRDSSLQGLVTFLDFCRELDAFLRISHLPPLLRYEAWHLYGYWFGNLSTMVGDHLEIAVTRVASWKIERSMAKQEDKNERLKIYWI